MACFNATAVITLVVDLETEAQTQDLAWENMVDQIRGNFDWIQDATISDIEVSPTFICK